MQPIYIITEIVVAVMAVLGVAIFGLAGKSKESTNDALVQENTSLRNQLGDKTIEAETLKVRAEKAEKNEQYLKDLAQSKPDFNKVLEANTKVSVQLTTQHQEILQSFSGLTTSITKLAQTITKDRQNLNRHQKQVKAKGGKNE